MLPTPPVYRFRSAPRHAAPRAALPACATALALVLAALMAPPAGAQTAASTDKAQERSQHQTDNVYRWIKYFADQQQPQKADPNKAPRPKAETPQPAKRPEVAKAQTESAPSTPAAVAADAAPAQVPAPVPAAQQQATAPAVAPAVAAAAAATTPEPEVAAQVLPPLRPLFVVEPAIPREMRDETINSRVLLSFTVQQDGTVASPTVVSGSNRRLNRSAMGAIAQWRFEPIQANRVAQIEFEFRQE